MAGTLLTEFSDSDILFLVETIDPQLVTKIDTLKGDPTIIEEMLDQGAGETRVAGKPHYRRGKRLATEKAFRGSLLVDTHSSSNPCFI